MNATDLLKQDHEKVKKLMEEIDSTTERGVKTRNELFTRFKQEMTVHERIEEEIFYPRLTEQAKTRTSRSRATRSTTSSTWSWPSSTTFPTTTSAGAPSSPS